VPSESRWTGRWAVKWRIIDDIPLIMGKKSDYDACNLHTVVVLKTNHIYHALNDNVI
jgi:hypothetical protein